VLELTRLITDGNAVKDGPVAAPPPSNETTQKPVAAVPTTETMVVYSCEATLTKAARRYSSGSRTAASPAPYRCYVMLLIGFAFVLRPG
jgi:hypothetical protein